MAADYRPKSAVASERVAGLQVWFAKYGPLKPATVDPAPAPMSATPWVFDGVRVRPALAPDIPPDSPYAEAAAATADVLAMPRSSEEETAHRERAHAAIARHHKFEDSGWTADDPDMPAPMWHSQMPPRHRIWD